MYNASFELNWFGQQDNLPRQIILSSSVTCLFDSILPNEGEISCSSIRSFEIDWQPTNDLQVSRLFEQTKITER